jgi:hypothetical protein
MCSAENPASFTSKEEPQTQVLRKILPDFYNQRTNRKHKFCGQSSQIYNKGQTAKHIITEGDSTKNP